MFRGGVGFTPKWMAMNPKTYTTKTDHHGVMAQNRCGRDDLIGIQKKEQGRDVPSIVKQPPQQPQQQQADTTTTANASSSSSGMNQEQKRVKRKRDLLLQNLSDLDSQEDRAKRRRQEEKNLERRTVPTHLLFKK